MILETPSKKIISAGGGFHHEWKAHTCRYVDISHMMIPSDLLGLNTFQKITKTNKIKL